MAEVVTSRTMRADNYALSEETKRLRDSEQARLTDHAFAEAVRLLTKHRASLDRVAARCSRRRRSCATSSRRCSADVRRRVAVERDSSASCAGRSRAARRTDRRRSIAVCGHALASIISASRSRTSTRRSATYERLFGAELEHRATVADQGVEAAAVRVGAGGSSCSRRSATTRPSAASSRRAGRACTTSPSRSTDIRAGARRR